MQYVIPDRPGATVQIGMRRFALPYPADGPDAGRLAKHPGVVLVPDPKPATVPDTLEPDAEPDTLKPDAEPETPKTSKEVE